MIRIPFTPAQNRPFQFQAVFDGRAHTVIVTWGLSGQRYYVNIYTLQGVRVLTIPMVGSPVGYDISLTAGYFNTKLVWRIQNGNFEII